VRIAAGDYKTTQAKEEIDVYSRCQKYGKIRENGVMVNHHTNGGQSPESVKENEAIFFNCFCLNGHDCQTILLISKMTIFKMIAIVNIGNFSGKYGKLIARHFLEISLSFTLRWDISGLK
jgi:hypothetical protein